MGEAVERRLDVRIQHRLVSLGTEVVDLGEPRPGRAAWAGTRTSTAQKSASKTGSSTSFSAAWTTPVRDTRYTQLAELPRPPGLGIMRSRTGSGCRRTGPPISRTIVRQ